jgi:hypothetical protein
MRAQSSARPHIASRSFLKRNQQDAQDPTTLQDSVINGALAVDGERLRASGGGRVLSP